MDQDELTKHLTRLTHTVTEVLLWVQAAEKNGVLPPGTLGEAQRIAEEDRTMTRIKTVQHTLDMLDNAHDLASLLKSLNDSLKTLEARVVALRRSGDET